eukprot:Pgem_evm1s7578
MFSLQTTIRTCKIDTNNAVRLQSDRFLNSCNAACPAWDGKDQYQRMVCEDSMALRTLGCNAVSEVTDLETSLRPHYNNYITVGGKMDGLHGNLRHQGSVCRAATILEANELHGTS